MNIIDIIICAIAAVALFKGFRDGLVRQVGGIAGLLLGIFLASKFSSLLSTYLHQWINASEQVVKSISFVVIIIAVVVLMNLLGILLEKILKVATLGWLNRLLGMVLSVAAAALVLGVLFNLVDFINESWFKLIPEETLKESAIVPVIRNISDVVFPYLKNFFN